MRGKDIQAGQTLVTVMKARFASHSNTLSPIKILAHVEGFVIFSRDNIKSAIDTKQFIQTYIRACKYKLND